MKKKILAYFSGVFATVLVLTMVTTALAASGKATFNFVNVSLRGERKIAAGADITVANGQKVPSSILYTDEKGGKTNYLPIRASGNRAGGPVFHSGQCYQSGLCPVQSEPDRRRKAAL